VLNIDMSNLVFSGALDYHHKTKETIDLDLLRHIILNSLRSLKSKLNIYADEVNLLYDGRAYWRKEVFPYYKGKRKAGREASTFDWTSFFSNYDILKQEFRENLPFRSIEVAEAEADDLMAVICKLFGNQRQICNATSDNDMIQIQQFIAPSVKQWSMNQKKFLTPENAGYDLFEHIVCGDTGDGVPNILSPGDTLMAGVRQKSMRKEHLAEMAKHGITQPEKFCTNADMLDRFRMNKTLIDLRCIPEDIVAKIADAYRNTPVVKGKTFSYLTSKKLMKIIRDGGF
jgi:hypothetical protein